MAGAATDTERRMKTVMIHGALLSRRTLYCVSQRTGCYGDGRQHSGSRAIISIAPDGLNLVWELNEDGQKKSGSFAFFLTNHADMAAQVATLLVDLLPRPTTETRVPSCIFDFHCLYYVEAFANFMWRANTAQLTIHSKSRTEFCAGDFSFKFIPEGVRVGCKGGSAVVLYPKSCCLNKTTGAIYGEGAGPLLCQLVRVAESFTDLSKAA